MARTRTPSRVKTSTRTSKVPKGFEVQNGRVLVDARLTAIRLGPGLIVFAPRGAATAARMSNAGAWASCKCSKDGSCKISLKPLPGGDKAEIVCDSGTCKGDCTAHAGEFPKAGAGLMGGILAFLAHDLVVSHSAVSGRAGGVTAGSRRP